VHHRAWTALRYDVPASLVVFLVAVPLSLGIAVATGAPVMAGLTAAVVGGIVAGLLGGSPLQVSGPAAGLTVVADLIVQFGWGVMCAITAAAGLLQVLFGISRMARAALAISPAVVHAMLAGIGITIAAGGLVGRACRAGAAGVGQNGRLLADGGRGHLELPVRSPTVPGAGAGADRQPCRRGDGGRLPRSRRL
jgi:hypothetical protein